MTPRVPRPAGESVTLVLCAGPVCSQSLQNAFQSLEDLFSSLGLGGRGTQVMQNAAEHWNPCPGTRDILVGDLRSSFQSGAVIAPAGVRGLVSEQDTLGMERKRGAMETAGVPHIPLERAGPAPLPVGPRCNKVLRSQSRSMFGFLVFPPGAAALRLTTRGVVPTVLNGTRGREGTPGIILGVP